MQCVATSAQRDINATAVGCANAMRGVAKLATTAQATFVISQQIQHLFRNQFDWLLSERIASGRVGFIQPFRSLCVHYG